MLMRELYNCELTLEELAEHIDKKKILQIGSVESLKEGFRDLSSFGNRTDQSSNMRSTITSLHSIPERRECVFRNNEIMSVLANLELEDLVAFRNVSFIGSQELLYSL